MSPADLIRFAFGALRGHRLRTWLSLVGVGIGVASVILLTSLGEGARLYVTGEFTSLGSNLLIVIPGKTETLGATPFVSTAPHDLTVEDSEAVMHQVREVRRVAPLSFGMAPAQVEERRRDTSVLGTTHAMLRIRGLSMGSGRFLPEGVRDGPVVVLGAKVAQELFGNRNPLGGLVRIGDTRFRVIGVLAPLGTSIGLDVDEVAIVPVDSALRLFNRTSLFRILAEVGSAREIEQARDALIAVLAERHGEEDVTVLTQDAVLSTFQRILNILTAALAGIAAISLTVAGIGIMNVMLVSVSERTREIGLLKALGGTQRQILTVFLIEATLISTGGGLLGLGVGIGLGQIARQVFPDFPVQPPVWAVAASLLVSASVGILFGGIPARNASRLDPVEALMRQRT